MKRKFSRPRVLERMHPCPLPPHGWLRHFQVSRNCGRGYGENPVRSGVSCRMKNIRENVKGMKVRINHSFANIFHLSLLTRIREWNPKETGRGEKSPKHREVQSCQAESRSGRRRSAVWAEEDTRKQRNATQHK